MFSSAHFNQDAYTEQMMMQLRKRPYNGGFTSSPCDPIKRADDNRNKENCSPELPMIYFSIHPMYQSTPIMPGQRETFQSSIPMPPQAVTFYPSCFAMQPPIHSYCADQNSLSSDSGVLSDDSNLHNESVRGKCFPIDTKSNVSVGFLEIKSKANPLEVFDEAPGRLCLLNASTRYKVTLSEIQRRMNHPETLHASLINGILRKAKTKDGCKMLRDRLAEKGYMLPSGRRKTAPTTSFTALCEREALVMARDFSTLCNNSLNTFEIARHSNRLQYSLHDLVIIRRYFAGLMAIVDEVPEDPEDYVEKNSATRSLNIFSLLTHGFGHNALKATLRVIGKIIDQQQAMLQGVPSHGPPFIPHHMQQFP